MVCYLRISPPFNSRNLKGNKEINSRDQTGKTQCD